MQVCLLFQLHFQEYRPNIYYPVITYEIMTGFIYIMSNPFYEGLLKIGQTCRDPLVRRKELSTTGVPEEFVIEYQALVSDYRRQEKLIHQKLSKVRYSKIHK